MNDKWVEDNVGDILPTLIAFPKFSKQSIESVSFNIIWQAFGRPILCEFWETLSELEEYHPLYLPPIYRSSNNFIFQRHQLRWNALDIQLINIYMIQ